MKICSQCNQELPLDMFDLHSKGNHRSDCKECYKRHGRSKSGLVKQMYTSQKTSAKSRGYQPPTYTENELYVWLMTLPEFHLLYDSWVLSKYKSNLKPSCDRLNDYKSYTLDNIQITTWKENDLKGRKNNKNGDNLKQNIAVDMLSKEGEFIQRFHSISEAARFCKGTVINIYNVMNNKTVIQKKQDGSAYLKKCVSAYKYIWRYSEIPNSIKEIT